ncbi:non-reducing polyketide synthase [Fusarium flagelliforme]|uniref:Non-reducing polyketide synthase n=1 Tax=Fusarium flagelliforme TaxID=2675880 RepID=A0A395N1H7_9HYPO|nr:non-reducing polyketide synthase [Fusarium flagelliforme]
MAPNKKTILLFGDQTDSWVDGIDRLYQDAASSPWLQSFLDDLTHAFKAHTGGMDAVLRESLGDFATLQELAEKYRYTTDDVGMAQAFLIYAVRAGIFLKWAKQEPSLLSIGEDHPEWVGISGGLISFSVLAVAETFEKLYEACLEVAGLLARLCRFTSVKSRSMEDRSGAWGWTVLGIEADDLRNALDQYQQSMGIPPIKRAQVAVTGHRWNTIVGPPSILQLVVKECPAIRSLPKNELNIHALQHTVVTSQADLDYIVGDSTLLSQPLPSHFTLWGMDDPRADYTNWGDMLRAICSQALSRPLDIKHVVHQLSSKLRSFPQLHVKPIGPCSHLSYLTSVLKSAGRTVSIADDHPPSTPPKVLPGRIAIVGMAGRGPGSDNVEEFWNVIMSKLDLCEEIPEDRFKLTEFFRSKHDSGCTTTTKFGCFMNKPGHFDNRFFHISPREALLMDPGHRQFLMTTYEALESAGYSDGGTRDVDPARIATFFGQCNDDWHDVSHHTLGCDAYTLQGVQRAFGAGRVAFQFKWEGPTYSLDSACASTASSIHLACTSLLAKETDMAVAGAANVVGYPHSWTSLSKSGVLSDTGNCKTFRDDADGYCRADFVGTVVLKRLEDAIAHNDNILAVVAASGRNHSGNSSSITTSDAEAQERLFRKMMQNARVSPNDISYVEMHGTGTKVGDPAEMGALASLFAHRRAAKPVVVGGVKANVGHSESAAGIASLLKCIMMFQKNILPPQAGMPHALNPNFPPLSEINIEIPSEPSTFGSPASQSRRILLNNFDAAGGNACILLEDYADDVVKNSDPRVHHVVATSARTQASYHGNKVKFLQWLRANPTARIEDVAYTTTARRTHHPIRSAFTVSSTQELIDRLEADTADSPAVQKSPVVFVFTGQGSHYAGMGSTLYETSPVFRETVNLCATICEEQNFPPFLDLITQSDSEISHKTTLEVQLAVLTLEIGLAALWRSFGIQPSVVIGHSLGEYAALHVSGVLSLADVLYLVGQRALLMLQRCEVNTSAMLSVSMPVADVHGLLETQADPSCEIACVNSTNASVISGSIESITQLQTGLKGRPRMLSVPYGFHSSQMDPILADYAALAGGVTFSEPKVPVASTLLGSIVETSGTFNAGYMARQCRQPVNFVGALEAIQSNYTDPVWLELGPSQICSSFVRATLSPPPSRISSTLDNRTNAWLSVGRCLSNLYKNGATIDWLALHQPYVNSLKLLNLPTYAWDLKDFWISYTETKDQLPASTANGNEAFKVNISTCAQQIIEHISPPNMKVTFRASLQDSGFKTLIDGHRLRDKSVCPGSVFSEAALAAVNHVLQLYPLKSLKGPALVLRHLSLKRPLTYGLVGLDGDLITVVAPEAPSSHNFKVSWKATKGNSSYSLGDCLVAACDGQVIQAGWDKVAYFIRSRVDEIVQSSKNGIGHLLQPQILYALFANTVQYDAAFKCIKEAYISSDFQEAAAVIVLQPDPKDTQFIASPYWGESLVHLAGFVANSNPDRQNQGTTFMMDGFDSFEQTVIPEPGKPYHTYVRVTKTESASMACNVYIFDKDKLIMHCAGIHFHEVGNTLLDQLLGGSNITRDQPPPIPPRKEVPKPVDTTEKVETVRDESHSDTSVLDNILNIISKETGSDLADFQDDTLIADLGVDSIMAIEIASQVTEQSGVDLLPSFIIDYPAIGDLRRAFAPKYMHTSVEKNSSKPSLINDTPQTPQSSSSSLESFDQPSRSVTSTSDSGSVVKIDFRPDDDSPAPKVKITLLQGRPGNARRPFYLIADGTGTIATYIHLPQFKSQVPIYGIDSPFLRCPTRFTTDVGITGAARFITEALIKAQPEGAFLLGGFSGGAMLAYEVCRQLATANREVDGLMLIDMCSPRSKTVEDKNDIGWAIFESISRQNGLWRSTDMTRQHLQAIFAAVATYHPQSLKASQRPKRTAIIWAEKGMIDRCAGDSELMQKLAKRGIPTEPYPRFMEDSELGPVAWGLPHKTQHDLGLNGWDKYIGEALCLSIPADHLEMPMPGHVHLLHETMARAFEYFDESN